MLLERNQDLSLEERYFLIRIGGEQYIIVEATSEAATQFRITSMSKISMKEGRMEGLSGVPEAEPMLVSKCLYKIEGVKDDMDDLHISLLKRTPVPLLTVKSWPNRVIKALFDKAKEISVLDEQDDEAKNSSKPTDPGLT